MEHLLIFQYGDYGAGFRLLDQGLPETYRDQKASVAMMQEFAASQRVTTVAICDRPHEEELLPNLWSIGITREQAYSARPVWKLLNRLAPSRVILRTPHRYALAWTRWHGLPTLPIFADIFSSTTLRQRLENRLAHWALSGTNVPCVANHSLNASLSLRDQVGIAPERILPWDRHDLRVDPNPKPAAPKTRPFQAFYAGMICEEKGVGDCLAAAALLAQQGRPLQIDFAGTGDLDAWQQRAAGLGLGESCKFLGRLANAEVHRRMRAADVVLVPSRHDYPEGLPNTLSEALAARTPLVTSDHPAFASRLRHGRDCLVFRAADPQSLAAELVALQDSPDLQVALSTHAPKTLARLPFGLNWFKLIQTFAEDPRNTTGWVVENSLATLLARPAALQN